VLDELGLLARIQHSLCVEYLSVSCALGRGATPAEETWARASGKPPSEPTGSRSTRCATCTRDTRLTARVWFAHEGGRTATSCPARQKRCRRWTTWTLQLACW